MTSQTQSKLAGAKATGTTATGAQARTAVTSYLLERRADGSMTIAWKDADGKVVSEVTMSANGTTTVWKDVNGAVERTVEMTRTQDGGEVAVEKDPAGHITSRTETAKDKSKTVTSYDKDGKVAKVSRHDAVGALVSEQESMMASDGVTPITIDTFYKGGVPSRKTVTFPDGSTDDLSPTDDVTDSNDAAPLAAPLAEPTVEQKPAAKKGGKASKPTSVDSGKDAPTVAPIVAEVPQAPAPSTPAAPVSSVSLPTVEDIPATEDMPAGKKTSFHKAGRLSRTLETYADGSSISTTYNRNGSPAYAKGTYADGSIQEIFYQDGAVARTVEVESDGVRTETEYEDGHAAVVRESHPDGRSAEEYADGSMMVKYPDGKTIEMAFQDSRKAVCETEADGFTRTTVYDLVTVGKDVREICRHVEEKLTDGTTLTKAFSARGVIESLSVVDPRGQEIGKETYDAGGEIAQRQQALDDGSWLVTEFEMEAPSVITVKHNSDGSQIYTDIDGTGAATKVYRFDGDKEPVALDLSQAVYPRPILSDADDAGVGDAPVPDAATPGAFIGKQGAPRIG